MTGSIESSTAVRFEYSNCAPNTGTWANCISHSNEPEDPCESRARWIRRHDLGHSCATLRLARGVRHGETGMRRSGHCTVKEREPVLTLAPVALLSSQACLRTLLPALAQNREDPFSGCLPVVRRTTVCRCCRASTTSSSESSRIEIRWHLGVSLPDNREHVVRVITHLCGGEVLTAGPFRSVAGQADLLLGSLAREFLRPSQGRSPAGRRDNRLS